jgi:zinc transporter ZupT
MNLVCILFILLKIVRDVVFFSSIGDYAVLIQSGFTHVRAVLWNFLSATTAFVGFFIGVAVSEDKSARQWIFAVTTGMFIYIALVGLVSFIWINYIDNLFIL